MTRARMNNEVEQVDQPIDYRDKPDYKAMPEAARRVADLYMAMDPQNQLRASALLEALDGVPYDERQAVLEAEERQWQAKRRHMEGTNE